MERDVADDAMTVRLGGGRIDSRGRHHALAEREVEISRKGLLDWVRSVLTAAPLPHGRTAPLNCP